MPMQWCTKYLEPGIDVFVFPGLGQLVKEERYCLFSHSDNFSSQNLIFPKRKITQILTDHLQHAKHLMYIDLNLHTVKER